VVARAVRKMNAGLIKTDVFFLLLCINRKIERQGRRLLSLYVSRCVWGCLRCEEGESISLRGVSRLRAGDVITASDTVV
jgi:hypothetical protein